MGKTGTKRLAAAVLVGGLGVAATEASAQTGVPMPSPMDAIQKRGLDKTSPCGKQSKQQKNPVQHEVEAIYSRFNRCGEHSSREYGQYRTYIRGFDPDEKRYPRGVVGDYETVANYFNYHGITWWDGKVSPGYRETARYAGQIAPGLTARYAGTVGTAGARPSPDVNVAAMESEMARLESGPAYRPTASDFADDGELGACGIPYLDQAGKADQEFFAEEGECAEYVAEIEAEGY